MQAYQAAYRRQHQARVSARERAYRDKHQERLKARRRWMREQKPEIVAEWKRRDYERHQGAYKTRASRHWYRKSYPGLPDSWIEALVLAAELRRRVRV